MRDLLNDLESGKTPAELDPIRRAQSAIRKPLPKRFYKDVSVTPEEDGGFAVRLDGKSVRTPGASAVRLPNEATALLVAGEYQAQGEHIDPESMPVTRLVDLLKMLGSRSFDRESCCAPLLSNVAKHSALMCRQ